MTTNELGKLAEIYGKNLYSFCYYLTGNKIDADDLYQETFLKAIEKKDKIDAGKNVKCFLMGIATKTWNNSKRKFARRQRIAPTEAINDDNLLYSIDKDPVESTIIQKECMEIIQLASKSMPSHLNIVLYLYYTAGMSTSEISKILLLPKGTIGSRLYKARSIIKTKLEEHGYETE